MTPSGIINDVNDEQPPNAPFPILVTPSGIAIDIRDEQLENK